MQVQMQILVLPLYVCVWKNYHDVHQFCRRRDIDAMIECWVNKSLVKERREEIIF